MSQTWQPLDLYGMTLAPGTTLIEASAGTGKTYSMTQLVVRLLLEAQVPLGRMLVVTFTRAAAAELRERIHERLVEVRALLEGGAGEDEALAQWVAGLPDPQAARRRLEGALLSLDEAPILTIDGFVSRVLNQHALAMGMAFDAALVEDEGRLKREVAERIWLSLNEAPEAVRKRVLAVFDSAQKLQETLGVWPQRVAFEPEPMPLEELVARLDEAAAQEAARALRDHLKTLWDEGCFCKKRGTTCPESLPPRAFEGLMERLARLEVDRPGELLEKLQAALKPGCEKKLDAAVVEACMAHLELWAQLLPAWVAQAQRTFHQMLEDQLARQGAYTFASLKRRLAQAVEDGTFAEQLAREYDACLIDEFQDTDADQWRIFSRLFQRPDKHLYLIGDPKQAIYRFRGANLAVYFEARKTAQRRFHLTVNYRSDARLLDAINELFADREGAPAFDHPQLAYVPVRAPQDRRLPISRDGAVLDEPVEWAWAPSSGNGSAKAVILAQLQRDVVAALERMRIDDAPLEPGQIAVLVNSNDQGLEVQRLLRQVGVPAVFSARESVWRSEAARALAALLQALLHPTRLEQVRAVLISPLFGRSLPDLEEESEMSEAQAAFAEAAQRWRDGSLIAAVEGLLQRLGGWAALAGREDGSRWLADVRHLLELLQAHQRKEQATPRALVRHLLHQLHHAHDEDGQLRLESDEEAVQIITMHKAKGLQFPVVFCPFLGGRERLQEKAVWPVVDRPEGQVVCWQDKEEAHLQWRQERLRLAYVALTRAERYLKIYWDLNRAKGSASWSPLGWLVARQDWSSLEKPPVGEQIEPEADAPRRWQGRRRSGGLQPPPAVRRPVLTRQLGSYTQLVRHEPEAELPEALAEDGLPRGAAFGSWLHDLLERHAFSELVDLPVAALRSSGAPFGFGALEDAHYERVRRLLGDVVAASLDPAPLSRLDPARCLKEMHFVMAVGRLTPVMLNGRLEGRPEWAPVDFDTLRGHLQGFVDLVFEQGGRFYVVDYKSNLLPGYDPPQLLEAMRAHRYGLQALIYTLALHRYLKQRLPDYDYDRHMGGVRYLFLRGMKAGEASGICPLRFERALIEWLDAATGGAGDD